MDIGAGLNMTIIEKHFRLILHCIGTAQSEKYLFNFQTAAEQRSNVAVDGGVTSLLFFVAALLHPLLLFLSGHPPQHGTGVDWTPSSKATPP